LPIPKTEDIGKIQENRNAIPISKETAGLKLSTVE
jgi:hypothetical protein